MDRAPSTIPETRRSRSLGEAMQAVAQTILEGARLEVLLHHDRLGLDQEMEFLRKSFRMAGRRKLTPFAIFLSGWQGTTKSWIG